ncbi:VanZ family protein [Paenibacillus agilis]|uniref:VanZ family protein n=1 Tax=Paenibacillus agilis TaxID=3020863 RepID=A0A559IWU4_9BACL|nr:VanZ family protein [Paenibacillus agilis]TVX92061.1 VanZ family protein [Paenibacillus agilis]
MTITHKRKFIIWLVLTVVWMGVIFYKSSEPYTDQDLRPAFASLIEAETLQKYIPELSFYYDNQLITWEKPYDFVEFFIRKAAHVFSFALLCFFSIKTLYATSMKDWAAIGLSGLLSFLYACSDEWHQSFVVGRTGHIEDVMVDSIGIVLIVLIMSARAWRRWSNS